MALGVSTGGSNPFEEAGEEPLVSMPAHDGTCGHWVSVLSPKGNGCRIVCQSKKGHAEHHEAALEVYGRPIVLRWPAES